MKEIERKYLLYPSIDTFLKNIPHSCQNITQFYTKVTPTRSVRFRKIDGKYYKTVKKGQGGIREEVEKEISQKSYLRNL